MLSPLRNLRPAAVLILALAVSTLSAGPARSGSPAAPFADLEGAGADSAAAFDQVVVYLRDGKIADGYLLAKSRSMLMLRTEEGRLTIPKKDVWKVEYISTPYAEQGEPVVVELVTGKRIEGYLEREDPGSLSLLTELGRLTIDKENLRSVEYAASPGFRPSEGLHPVRTLAPPSTSPGGFARLGQKDRIAAGYSASWGNEHDNGIVVSYARILPLHADRSFSVGASAGLEMAWFGLDERAFRNTEIPGGVSVSGYGLVWTLGLGLPLENYPQEGAAYRFRAVPQLNLHLVRKSLDLSYPSFPDQDSRSRKTRLRLGVGLDLGVELNVTGGTAIGVGYNPKVLFGESDFSYTSLYVVARPLFF